MQNSDSFLHHRAFAGGLRHAGGGAGDAAVRGAASAHRHCARAAEGAFSAGLWFTALVGACETAMEQQGRKVR